MSYMRSEERQRHILQCAKRVFAERGFHASNVSHICAAAGIGRGTLYLYFANKKAVFTAIVRECLARVQALMSSRLPGSYPPPHKLRRGDAVTWSAGQLRRVFEVVFEDEPTLRILLREAVGLDVDVEKLLGEIDEVLIAVVAADLADSQRAGIVRRDLDPQLTATLMVGGVEKLALAALRGAEPIDIGRLALETARLHLVGILSELVAP